MEVKLVVTITVNVPDEEVRQGNQPLCQRHITPQDTQRILQPALRMLKPILNDLPLDEQLLRQHKHTCLSSQNNLLAVTVQCQPQPQVRATLEFLIDECKANQRFSRNGLEKKDDRHNRF